MITRSLYVGFLYYLVVEGAFRKWAFPEFSNELFLLKDVLLMAAAFMFYVVQSRRGDFSPLSFRPLEGLLWHTWVIVALIGAAAAAFSLTGFIGLRYYLVPLLIFAVHPALARNVGEFEHFVSRYLIVCMGICILGFFQFASGPDHLINRYSWSPDSEMDVATFGEATDRATDPLVRITGTFSYISPFASYLQFAFFCAIGMFLTQEGERSRLWYGALIVAILANLFMTGSRGPALVSIILGFILFVRNARGGRYGIVGFFLGLVTVGLGLWLLRDTALAMIERNEMAGDAPERIGATLLFPIYTVIHSEFWGEGVGATFLGIGQLTGTGRFEYRFDEVLQDRLAVEVGILGYFFFLFFKIYFLVATWRYLRRARSFHFRVWAMMSFCYQASLVWTVPVYNSVAMVFYFFSIALFSWLRRLDEAERNDWVGRAALAATSGGGLRRF